MIAPSNPRELLECLFEIGVAAAHPKNAIPRHLPEPVAGRTFVVGAGKASAAMAHALETAWTEQGYGPLAGLVVTQYGYGVYCISIEIVEAAHPVPDEKGVTAARRILEIANDLGADDQLITLISGGGSSLLCLPPDSIGLKVKQEINAALLRSGATIREINTIRKNFSLIKGGRLACAASPARVVTLVLSDIPGDEPQLVASGPTLPDVSSVEDARRIIQRYRLKLPQSALDWLTNDSAAAPAPAELVRAGNTTELIGSAQQSLQEAANYAEGLGITTHILSDCLEGEARDVGAVHAGIVHQVLKHGQPFKAPCIVLSGGETSVSLKGNGRGGRNTEFLLSFACGTRRLPVQALSADTDGIDGSESNAGAFSDGTTIERLLAKNMDPNQLLEKNDAWTAFSELNDLFETGPTQTNVNDFRAIAIGLEGRCSIHQG